MTNKIKESIEDKLDMAKENNMTNKIKESIEDKLDMAYEMYLMGSEYGVVDLQDEALQFMKIMLNTDSNEVAIERAEHRRKLKQIRPS